MKWVLALVDAEGNLHGINRDRDRKKAAGMEKLGAKEREVASSEGLGTLS